MTSYDQWKTTDPTLEECEEDEPRDEDDEDDRDPLEVEENRPLPTEDDTGLTDVDI